MEVIKKEFDMVVAAVVVKVNPIPEEEITTGIEAQREGRLLL